ncbi:MAG: RelA/SpoT family protein [Fimbriimonadaceae bacterium]
MSAVFDISHEWEEPDGLHDLLQAIREQRPDANVKRIRYAYFLAEEAHSGQQRSSGEAYIQHPLAVARILVDLHLDDDTIVAALLHDVLEDTEAITREKLRDVFGQTVLDLVEGVTKLSFDDHLDLTARQRAAAETARTAETLRKMLLAMARDFRVMVIKLADRLHNMQTIAALAPDKRIRIANETLDVYAPLAARLGIWQIKWKLEDLAFQVLHPEEYARVRDLVAKSRGDRETDLSLAVIQVKDRFAQKGIRAVDIQGRPKHLYSIFNKMVKQGIPFEEIYDLLALRIITEDFGSCYLALGAVHELWVPIPGLFYDYIARPKPNGYQSLHTKVVGPNGQPLEVQIRTLEMHQIAEYGVAAHWTYKEGNAQHDEGVRLAQLRERLFDWSSDAGSSSDFLRSLSTDLFSEQVFVFTPKGDVIDLPKDSTPVDFAFRVHSQIGLTLVGSKVNGQLVPLATTLQNGDVVELVTRNNATPSLDWLEFVKSAHTRSKLRSHFRKLTKDDDAARGRDLLSKELQSMDLDPRGFLGEDKLDQIASTIDGAENAADVLAKVGAGLLSVQSVVQKLRGKSAQPQVPDAIKVGRTKEGRLTLTISGEQDIMVNRAKCCNPIPGDEVVGYVTRGRGIMIHRKVCPNALSYQTNEPERLIAYEWPPDGSLYQVDLKIISVNRQGLLMDVSTIFGESKTNISAARVKTLPNHTAEIEVSIDVTDTEHLAQIMTKISNFSDVISILRLFGRSASR